MARARIRIVGGVHRLRKIREELLERLREYNDKIKSTGFFLVPVKEIKVKISWPSGLVEERRYQYYGRYWYMYVSDRSGRGLRPVYVGRSKPLETLPDPPEDPLKGVRIYYDGEDLLVPEDQFERVKDLFKGYPVQRESWW